MTRFLLLDDILGLSTHCETLTPVFNFSFDSTFDLEEARQKVQQEDYDACLVAESSAENYWDFIQEIRENQKRETPIAYFTPLFFDLERYETLKETNKIDFVLPFSTNRDIFAAVIRNLCKKKEEWTAHSLFKKLPLSLQQKYRQSLYSKFIRIHTLYQALQTHPSTEELRELRIEIHKITGSAGSYGYMQVSELCKSCEIKIQDLLENPQFNEQLAGFFDYFYHFFVYLRLYFQHILPPNFNQSSVSPNPSDLFAPTNQPSSSPSASTKVLLILSHDLATIQLFQKKCAEAFIELAVESNPEQTLSYLKSGKIQPYCLIVEGYYPIERIQGYSIIETAKKSAKIPPKQFGIILEKDDISQLTEAIEHHIDYILRTPLTEEHISNVLRHIQLHAKPKHFKVLIVDDDLTISNLAAHYLEEIGIQVKVLNDETSILQELQNFSPDLILLDILMPHYDGWKLLQTLRSDIRYHQLAIVLFTSCKDPHVTQKAYELKCDDIIFKPLDKENFQTRILFFINRYSSLKMKENQDPLTGLLTETQFYFLFESLLKQEILKDHRAALVLIELDQLNLLNQILGQGKTKEILISSSFFMKQNFSKSILSGYLEPGLFAFLFQDTSGGEIEFLLEDLFSLIRREIPPKEEMRFHFSAGVCLFNIKDQTTQPILDATKAALKRAQTHEGQPYEIVRLDLPTEPIYKKPMIYIIDDDLEILRMLTYVYESHGFCVKTMENGQEALNQFGKMTCLEDPSLIVLDRNLPDMDGIEILRTIKQKFPNQVTAIFLSSFASDRDILDGLKEGAIDYIAKPFNIPILIQKSYALLKR
jgi:DNA-binding response OmpR family regulator